MLWKSLLILASITFTVSTKEIEEIVKACCPLGSQCCERALLKNDPINECADILDKSFTYFCVREKLYNSEQQVDPKTQNDLCDRVFRDLVPELLEKQQETVRCHLLCQKTVWSPSISPSDVEASIRSCTSRNKRHECYSRCLLLISQKSHAVSSCQCFNKELFQGDDYIILRPGATPTMNHEALLREYVERKRAESSNQM
ncbi:unnamed protein product, partial [Mesorhabditis belari]|uniref:Uncharacterized protein n=1 Tax=Mesorhabditis belari TaxID=2138241 RepID=A0AAF3F560_9BILA